MWNGAHYPQTIQVDGSMAFTDLQGDSNHWSRIKLFQTTSAWFSYSKLTVFLTKKNPPSDEVPTNIDGWYEKAIH